MESEREKTYIKCTSNGVFKVYEYTSRNHPSMRVYDVLSAPMELINAWRVQTHIDSENMWYEVKVGGFVYRGDKEAIAKLIKKNDPKSVSLDLIEVAVSACIDHYITSGEVEIKDAFPAVGVFGENLELVLPNDPNRPIVAREGTEAWNVSNSFSLMQGDMKETLNVYANLTKWYDKNTVALLFGYSAIAPFFYMLKSRNDFYMPWIILTGMTGTGKSTLGTLFTKYLFGVDNGTSEELTSPFRALDFLQSTTFPRVADESENARLERTDYFNTIGAILKDASSRQLVGNRGTPNRVKEYYSALTPLKIIGNKVDITDQALLSRCIIINTSSELRHKDPQKRQLFTEQVLWKITYNLGIDLIKIIKNRFPTVRELSSHIEELRGKLNSIKVSDARRLDFYASIYTGIEAWVELFRQHGQPNDLENYLDLTVFTEAVNQLENFNALEGYERSVVTDFISWLQLQVDALKDMQASGQTSMQLSKLSNSLQIEVENGKETGRVFFTQNLLNEYRKENREFASKIRNLADFARAYSEIYNVPADKVYNRGHRKFGSQHYKYATIDLKHPLTLDNYNSGTGN
jgi:DNA polymerase III delta prime subunit